MKKLLFHTLCLILIMVLTFAIGCSTSTSITVKTAEEQTALLFGAELLSNAEIDQLKSNRERIPAGDTRAVMYYNGTELACLAGRRTFYVTVPQTAIEGTLHKGVLSGPSGYHIVFNRDLIPSDLTKMIENGNTLMVYMFGETDYFAAELIITYLPVISIDIDDDRNLSETLQGAQLTLHNSAADDANSYVKSRAEVKIRGASSKSFPKNNLRIDLKGAAGENRKISFLGMRRDDDWILTAMFGDENKIREMTAWQLWRDMNSYYPGLDCSCAPATAYVEVILNGTYQGLYMLMEKFDAKTMQLDEKSSDVLFKGTTWDIPDSNGLGKQSRTSSSYMGLEKKWPNPEETMPDGLWKVIAEYIHVVYETEGADFAAGIANAASHSNLIEYWIFTNLIMAEDNTFKNAYFSVKNGLVYVLPWDLDITFGLRWNGDPDTNYVYREPCSVSQTYDFRAGRRFIKYYDGAADMLQKRWTALRENGVITPEHIMDTAEAYWTQIHASGAIAREYRRWVKTSYSNDLTYFSDTIKQRIDWLDEYIYALE